MRIGVIHPSLVNVGGAERMAYFLATELDATIYTAAVREDIDEFYPGIGDYIRIASKASSSRMSLSSLLDLAKMQADEDLLVYITPRTILLKEFHPRTSYLYYVTTPNRPIYVALNHLWANSNLRGKVQLSLQRVIQELTWKQYVKRFVNPRNVLTISKTTYDRYNRIVGTPPRGFLYPPIDVGRYRSRTSEDFYLSVNRLSPLKGLELQMRAFRDTDERLVIVGDGPLRSSLVKRARRWGMNNVEFVGNISEEELLTLYAECKALIYSTFQCEFGLVSIEAMASGKPVLAINQGAPTEYIENDTNGHLFSSWIDLRRMITDFSIDHYEHMKERCLRTASRFDVGVWKKNVRRIAQAIVRSPREH